MIQVLVFLAMAAAAWYLLIVRPQRRMHDSHEQIAASLVPGDHILTVGGLIGTVSAVGHETVDVEFTAGSTTTVARSAIASKLTSGPTTSSASNPPTRSSPMHNQHQPHQQQHQQQQHQQPVAQPMVAPAPPQLGYAAPQHIEVSRPEPWGQQLPQFPHQPQHQPPPQQYGLTSPYGQPPSWARPAQSGPALRPYAVPAPIERRPLNLPPVPNVLAGFPQRQTARPAAQHFDQNRPVHHGTLQPQVMPSMPVAPQPVQYQAVAPAPQQYSQQQPMYSQPQQYVQQQQPHPTYAQPEQYISPQNHAQPMQQPYGQPPQYVQHSAPAVIQPALSPTPQQQTAPQPSRAHSHPPEGMGQAVRLDRELVRTFERAHREREELAEEIRRATAPLVAIDTPPVNQMTPEPVPQVQTREVADQVRAVPTPVARMFVHSGEVATSGPAPASSFPAPARPPEVIPVSGEDIRTSIPRPRRPDTPLGAQQAAFQRSTPWSATPQQQGSEQVAGPALGTVSA